MCHHIPVFRSESMKWFYLIFFPQSVLGKVFVVVAVFLSFFFLFFFILTAYKGSRKGLAVITNQKQKVEPPWFSVFLLQLGSFCFFSLAKLMLQEAAKGRAFLRTFLIHGPFRKLLNDWASLMCWWGGTEECTAECCYKNTERYVMFWKSKCFSWSLESSILITICLFFLMLIQYWRGLLPRFFFWNDL